MLAKDLIILDYGVSGNGFYEVNAIDGLNAANSPYLQFVRWTTHPNSGQQLRVRLGQLRGVFGANEFGLFVGTGTADTDRFLHLSDVADQNGIHNLPIRMFNGGINTGLWDSDGQFHIGFDGIAVANERDFTITTNALRIGRRLANYPNLLYSQAGGYLAFCSGTVNKIYFDDNGDSYFAGVMTIGTSGEIRQGTVTSGSVNGPWPVTNFTGLRIWRDGDIGRIAGYNNGVTQWSADTQGRLTAGAGKVWLNAVGLNFDATAGENTEATATWWNGTSRALSIGTKISGGSYASSYIATSGDLWLDVTGRIRTASEINASLVSTNSLNVINGYINSNNAFQFLTPLATAQAVSVASVLASSNYSHNVSWLDCF